MIALIVPLCWLLLWIPLASHETALLVATIVVAWTGLILVINAFFPHLIIPYSVLVTIGVVTVSLLYFTSKRTPNSMGRDPTVVAKDWVQDQLVRVTIVDWYNVKLETGNDGKLVVTGQCKGQSEEGVLVPPRYVFQVVLTASYDVVSNESWVKEFPSPI